MGDPKEQIKFNVYVDETYKAKLINMLPHLPTIITRLDVEQNTDETDDQKFVIELRTTCFDKQSALNWKAKFQELTTNSYNIDRTHNENTLKTIFKCTYHCLHNTRPPKRVKTPHYKHVNCPAKLTINIKNPKMKQSKDVYLKKFPCAISIRYTHNHNIFCADVLRHKRPTEAVETKFRELFGKGHSPSSALEIYKVELQDLDPENYYKVVANGSKWCYELYYNIFKKHYGDPNGPEMINSLSNVVSEYNEQFGGNSAAMSNDDDDDLVIAICSPMMKQVHKYIKSSGEIMFIDSSGNTDRHNSRIFLMLCPSVVGALPVGLMMTYSESEDSILRGLQLYKTLLDDSAFHNNLFPKVIITDDSTAEREALRKAFPSSTLLLCKFHIFERTMRYLWDSEHSVDENDRVHIYKLFHNLVNFTEENTFLNNFECLLNCDIVKKYKNVVKYLENLKQRSKEWASCYRFDIMTRGDYAEAGFRILKDKILHRNRTKAFSIPQVFSFLTEKLHSYYIRKITDVINNRNENLVRKYFIKIEEIRDFKYVEISNCFYKVISGENQYFVYTDIELCTCYKGKTGAPCKHQYGVATTFKLTSQQFIPTTDVTAKYILHKIITNTAVPNESLKSKNNVPQNICAVDMPGNIEDVNDEIANRITINTKIDSVGSMCKSNPNFSRENIEAESRQLLQNFKHLHSKLINNPDVFYSAIKKFNDLFSEVKTESSMLSALHTFGKYAGPGRPLIRKKNF